MAIEVKIYSPAGTEYTITNRVDASNLGTLNLRFEEEPCNFVADDLQLTLINTDNYFTSLWTLPLNPCLRYNESEGKGAWCIKVYKASSLRFEGDLDVASVMFDAKAKKVDTTWLSAVKRAEITASALKRVTTSPLYFTNERHKRILSFFSDKGLTTPIATATLHLQVGDVIKASKLQLNGNIIDQELTIKATHAEDSTLATNQARVRQGCKKVYSEGVCSTPYYTNKTVAECATLCFNAIGVASGKQVIQGNGTELTVDEFNTEDKTIAECLTDLAKYSGCVWFRETSTGKWYFIDRNSAKGSVKDISSLLCECSISASSDAWYDNVKVTGTPPHFAPNSPPRYYRYGSGHAKSYEVETKFTSSLATLATVAEQIYNSICKIRKKANITIVDDGTVYNILDRVSFNGENWFVVEVEEDFRAIEYKGTINLVVMSESGVTPDASAMSQDYNDDDWPPLPPTNIELGKGTDNPSSRPSWWSQARTQYPGGATNYPIKKVESIIDDDDNPRTPPKVNLKRLWFVRWKNEYATDDDPDGFIITVFNPNIGIEKPLQIHGYTNPKKHSDGYYYYPLYLACRVGAPEKCIVIQTYNNTKDVSAYSDEVSTYDWGGSVDDDNPFANTTFEVVKTDSDDHTFTFKLTFKDSQTQQEKVIPELSKIKICKSEAGATSPDLNRKQPPIDCLDYSVSPPQNTKSQFKITIPHKQGVFPRVWFRPVAYNEYKMDWTYDSTSGDGNSAPSVVQVRRVYATATGWYLEVSFSYAGETTGNKVKIWVQTNAVTGTPADGSGWATNCPNVINFADMQQGTQYWMANCLYYNDSSQVTSTLPASCKIIVAVYDSNGNIISNFSSVYEWIDLAQTIPQPSLLSSDFQIDEQNDKIIATWKWANTFTGYAEAFIVHGTSSSVIVPFTGIGPNGIMTPDYYENNGKPYLPYTIIDFGETGHKYKTLTSQTQLQVNYPIAANETAQNLFAKIILFLFSLDGGYMVFGNYGSFSYYCTDYQQFPEFTLTWNTSQLNQHSITIQWADDGTNYYIPIQKSPTGTSLWRDVNIVQGTLISGYRKYTLAGVSTSYKYRFRLARQNSYGTDNADIYHSAWKTISYTGGGVG